uniref:Uncharacterized protein n=1 Tax=Ditylenchus dipsaci TaxID=166011 RepID=A0A915DV67_9BILA
MMAYSSTDEATTSEEEENIEQRQQNLVAGRPNTPKRRAKRRQAVLMPELELRFIQSQRGKSLAIHEGDFFCFTFKDAENTDGEHNHVAEASDIEKKIIYLRTAELARQNAGKPREIFTEVTLDASNEVTANIDQLNIARCVYYHQKKLEENPNISCLPEKMMIPDDLKINPAGLRRSDGADLDQILC